MKSKKGFTLIELLGVVLLLGIIISLAVVAYSSNLSRARIKAFAVEETNFIDATKAAYVDCMSNNPNNEFCKYHKELEEKYTYDFVYLKELIDDDYIELIKNPYDTEEFCDMEKSYVYASRKNTTQENNVDLVYKACLICGDQKSEDCLDENLDYSTFDTTCTAHYDSVNGEVYDGAWTDRDIYLSFGASGNYRYGINEYVYTIDKSSSGAIEGDRYTNTASLRINKNVKNSLYEVQAMDGLNGKGTVVSCGQNIKIDKASIDSVKITGKTSIVSNVKNDSWVTEQVTFKANVEPSTSTSGYLYQWYYNGNKYGEQTTSSTLTAQNSGTYKVEVTNRVGKIVKTSEDFIIHIDRKAPTCELAIAGTKYNNVYTSDVNISFQTTADLEADNTQGSGIKSQVIDVPKITENVKNKVITGTVTDNVGRVGTCSVTITKDSFTPTIAAKSASNYITTSTNKTITDYFGIKIGVAGGSTVCKVGNTVVTNTKDLQLGVNTITCTTTGNNGKVNSASTTFRHQYTATTYCSSGRTLNNGNCIKSYFENESVCGCKTYNTCETSACGTSNYSCETSACGCKTANTCQSSACGCKEHYWDWKEVDYYCTMDMEAGSGSDWKIECESVCQNGAGSFGYGCTKYEKQELSSCRVYDTCSSESACGCETYNTCEDDSCGSYYESCESPDCGCETANSCTKIENEYRYYQCDSIGNNGSKGTLSGTTCSF